MAFQWMQVAARMQDKYSKRCAHAHTVLCCQKTLTPCLSPPFQKHTYLKQT